VGVLAVLIVALAPGSAASSENRLITCGIDSCWGPGTCKGAPADIIGTPGPDRLLGTAARDVIAARGGDDRIFGRGSEDLVCGGKGDDRLSGGGGPDGEAGQGPVSTLGPSGGLYGEQGRDVIAGNRGRDALFGGRGPDHLHGGVATDLCVGQAPQPDGFPYGDLADGTCEIVRTAGSTP
jgi:Ca2+-binding RTX toxin-like protein